MNQYFVRLLLSIILVTLVSLIEAKAQDNTIEILFWDNEPIVLEMKDKPSVHFKGEAVEIDNGQYCFTYPFRSMRSIMFKNIFQSDVFENYTGCRILIRDDYLWCDFSGGKIDVSIYNVSGNLISRHHSDSESVIVSLEDFSSGLYIISINGKSYKIIKK